MHKVLRLGAIALALSLAGCHTISYRTGLPGGGTTYEETGHYFLWGLAGEKDVNLRELCPKGVSKFRSQQTFVNGLIGFITLGIYIPRTITVECSGGQAYELLLDGTGRLLSIADVPKHAG